MPKSDGTFTPDETQLITTWLNTHWGKDKACEGCTNQTWGISQTPVAIPVLEIPGISLSSSYALVMVICTRCGNSKFINLGMIGIDWNTVQKNAKEAKNG